MTTESLSKSSELIPGIQKNGSRTKFAHFGIALGFVCYQSLDFRSFIRKSLLIKNISSTLITYGYPFHAVSLSYDSIYSKEKGWNIYIRSDDTCMASELLVKELKGRLEITTVIER